MRNRYFISSICLNFILILILLNAYIFKFAIRKRIQDILNRSKIISTEYVEPNYAQNTDFKIARDLYKIYIPRKANIIMFGDSITALIDWNELLGRNDVINRGVSGDITEGLFNRLQYIYPNKPKLCFIMVGTNDGVYVPIEKIKRYYVQILKSLKEHDIIPIIQSTLYIRGHDYLVRNPVITELNDFLKEYAEINNIDFIDLNKVLAKDNVLSKDYSYNGIHLNAEGYRVWREQLLPVIKKYEL